MLTLSMSEQQYKSQKYCIQKNVHETKLLHFLEHYPYLP